MTSFQNLEELHFLPYQDILLNVNDQLIIIHSSSMSRIWILLLQNEHTLTPLTIIDSHSSSLIALVLVHLN